MPNITPGPVVGKDCKLYYNAGTPSVPVWAEIEAARDVSANLAKGEADVSARVSGFKKAKGALKELEISFGYVHRRGADTVFDALLDSYTAGTPIELALMDGPITDYGAQGPRGYSEILGLNKTQELESADVYEITAKLTWHETGGTIHEPQWYENTTTTTTTTAAP